jgi:hypothetical protein
VENQPQADVVFTETVSRIQVFQVVTDAIVITDGTEPVVNLKRTFAQKTS